MKDKPTVVERKDAMAAATPEDGVKLLAGLPALDAFNLMLENPKPQDIVQLVPMENLYLMLHEIGSDDALLLLELASPEQVQGFIDLDCWKRDRLDVPKARTWFLLLNELEDKAFEQNIRNVDLALLVTFFGKHLTVRKIEEISDEILHEGVAFLTPDNRHLLEYTCGTEHSRLINALLMRISNMDLEFFFRLVEAIYWETGAAVEEDAYQERIDRLESRGFSDYYSALEILATVDVERFAPRRKAAPPARAEEPGAEMIGSNYLVLYEHPETLLSRALAVDFPGREETAVEIMAMANMAVTASNTPFFELDQVRRLVARTDGYLSIGLEYLGGRDVEKARENLVAYRLLDVHKVGRSLMMRQAIRARKLLPRVAVDRQSRAQLLVDGPEGECLAGLLKYEPVRRENQEDQLWTDLGQIREAEKALERVDALANLMEQRFTFTPERLQTLRLVGANISDPAELTYRVLFNTFRCHDWLGHAATIEPLAPADLQPLRKLLIRRDGRPDLPEHLHRQFDMWLEEAAGAVGAASLRPIFNRTTRELVTELARTELKPHFRHEILVLVSDQPLR